MVLLAPYNLVFVLPFVGALIYLLTMTFSGVGHTDGDADIGHDMDHDADLDHGVEHSVEHGHDHEQDAGEQETGIVRNAFNFLGFGRVPMSLLVMAWCFIWGFSGWASNTLLAFLPTFILFPISFAVALFCSVFLTRYLALGLAKIMPGTESYAASDLDLVGEPGEVRFAVTDKSGTVLVHDQYRNLREVPCRVNPGEDQILSGERVVLIKFDRQREAFIVTPESSAVR